MSILLDAVIRNKQQGQLPDPATAPRAYEQAERRFPMKAAAAVLCSLLAGGAAAFGLNLLLNKEDPVAIPPQQQTLAANASVSLQPPALPVQAVKPQPTVNNEEIRLAGRGNLPVAQPRPQLAFVESKSDRFEDSHREIVSQPSNLSSAAQVQVEAQRAAQSEAPPLVLGANTNLTPEQLEILRREAGTAPEGMADLGREAQAQQDNLLAAFEQALKEVEYQDSVAEDVSPESLNPIPVPQTDRLPKFGDLPLALQQQVPDFNIVAHVYASSPDNRWLNVDGRELQQGDTIGGKLKVVEIRPRDVILEIGGTEFTVPAI